MATVDCDPDSFVPATSDTDMRALPATTAVATTMFPDLWLTVVMGGNTMAIMAIHSQLRQLCLETRDKIAIRNY